MENEWEIPVVDEFILDWLPLQTHIDMDIRSRDIT